MDTRSFARFFATCTAIYVSLIAHLVSSAPTTSQATTSQMTHTDASDSCYTPISTSASWLETSGPWEHPCSSPQASLVVDTDILAMFQPSVSLSSLANGAASVLANGVELAEKLRQRIVENNMLNATLLSQWWDNSTLIPHAREQTNLTDRIQIVKECFKELSVALAYLEQNCHDEVPLCGRRQNIIGEYSKLQHKIKESLCKMQEMLNTLNSTRRLAVSRSVMPAEQRQLRAEGVTLWRARNFRDYVVSCDVKAILTNAKEAFGKTDWSQ